MTDVAQLAGVSHQTVSRVLNDSPSVSPRTRAKVLAAVERLGYRPNTAARALATGRSRTLGVLSMSGTLFGPASMLSGLQTAAREAQYGVMVVDLPSTHPEVLAQRMGLLIEQGVDGIVVIAPVRSSAEALRFAAGGLPLVAVEGEPEGEIDVVCVDQVAIGRIATQHLLDAGHPTVWHVTGPPGSSEAEGRESGWRQALTDAGADVPPPLPGDWSPRSGYDAGQLLVRLEGVTAVFAANDQSALGVLRALRERGSRVPEDVSLVGVDDIPEAAYLSPPLTTVRQDFAGVGRESMRAVLDQIESGARQNARVVLAPELVVRRSVGPPRPRPRSASSAPASSAPASSLPASAAASEASVR